tara:strand:+ start:71 stop:1471 length:1401 start_codon:yes stop_codon:yes gene_type:complete
MANTYLTRTPSGAGNKQKFTFSVWIKKQYRETGTNRRIISSYFSNGGRHAFLAFGQDEQLYAFSGNYTSGSSTTDSYRLNSSMLFRDPNAWYHIVYRVDTTQGTAADRIRCYVNGELLAWDTSHSDHLYPSQDDENYLNSDYPIQINALNGNGIMDCCMSHIHFCDGYSYDASSFGETDSTTGEWKIKTAPSVSYGTNGFFILKDDNSVTDQSGNSNNFTVAAGTLTKTEDNPSNVFATLNPLFKANGQATTFSNGNTTGQSPTSDGCAGTSTFGVNTGKYYAEFKQVTETSSGEGAVGICDTYYITRNPGLGGGSSPGYLEYSVSCFGYRNNNGDQFYSSGGSKYNSSNNHAGWSSGDIIMVGLDMDNNRLYLGKNGQWNSSNTWSSSTPSQYITIDSTGFEGNYHFAIGDSSGGNRVTWNANFGNGYFGTTAVSSAGTNASGNGIFEYDVPTGFTALSTKGLNL